MDNLEEINSKKLENHDSLKELLNSLTKSDLSKLTDELKLSWRDKKGTKKSEFITIILNTLNRNEINEDILNPLIKEIITNKPKKQKRISPKKPKIDINELMNKITLINNNIQLINQNIKQNNDEIEIIKNYMFNFDQSLNTYNQIIEKVKTSSIEKFLIKLNEEQINVNFEDLNGFDSMRYILSKNGFDDLILLKNGLLYLFFNEFVRSSKNLKWPDNLELFYKNVIKECEKDSMKFEAKPIYKIRNAVCDTTGMDKGDFDRQLGDCFKKGWVLLELGSPIGEEKVEHLILSGKKFYYLRLKKKMY